MREKIAIFADVESIYFSVRNVYQKHFNYKEFWGRATENREVLKAYAYAFEKKENKQKSFHHILRNIGFEVKLKPSPKNVIDRPNWDIGIVIDIIQCAPEVDVIILLSGNADFDCVLTYLKTQFNVRTEIYSIQAKTFPFLLNCSDQFIDIDSQLLI